ncbi:hypothetical protein PF007_g30448, partial [Phytophthora fragariae]
AGAVAAAGPVVVVVGTETAIADTMQSRSCKLQHSLCERRKKV